MTRYQIFIKYFAFVISLILTVTVGTCSVLSANSELRKAKYTEENNLPKITVLRQGLNHGPELRHSKSSTCTIFKKKLYQHISSTYMM